MNLDDLFQEADGVQASLKAQGPPPSRPLTPPEPMSAIEQLLAKVPYGVANNPAVAASRRIVTAAASPVVGGAQLIANAMPNSTGVPQLYNSKINEMEAKNEDAKRELSPVMAGVNDLAGNVISPTNLALAARLKPATGLVGNAIQGAGVGAFQGATAPVENGDQNFWLPKAGQTAIGTATGAVTQPALSAIGNAVSTRIAKFGADPQNAANEADKLIQGALVESGQTTADIPPEQLGAVRAQVQRALASGQKLDVGAAFRKADFDAERIQPTLGQITRDPQQWAEEQMVKGVTGVGGPLTRVLQEGNRAVSQGVGQYGANASEPAIASQGLATALRAYDATKQGDVNTAYATARASAGKDLEIPAQGLSDAYGQVVKSFGSKLPQEVKTAFEALPSQPLTFENANDLRTLINNHVGNDPPTNKALTILRSALNNAQTAAAPGGGPFAPAVKLAAERFGQHEEIPAIANAVNGPVDDNFVKRQVIANPSTPQVQKLAALLREQAPDTYQEVRQQIGTYLSNAAFGTNVAGDKLVAQESYNKALRQLGSGKLDAFFEPNEVEQLKRLGRIASYQVGTPAAAAANFSNTGSALANLLRVGSHIPFAPGSLRLAGDKVMANHSLNPVVPVSPNLSDSQRLALSRALTAISGGASAAGAGIVGQ